MTPVVAIAGAPNSGKTSLFNQLTGARRIVGNWPGQTVDRHEGSFRFADLEFRVVDLPGTYGLVAVSAEESITTEFLTREQPAAVITVVDSVNLTSGLHLVAQIAEAGLRQVIALNMADVAERRAITIDTAVIENALGVEVVRTVARRGEGVEDLRRAVATAIERPPPAPLSLDYGPVVERHLGGLVENVLDEERVVRLGPARWTLLQLLAGDDATVRIVEEIEGGADLVEEVRRTARTIEDESGSDLEITFAERRFDWVTSLAERATGPADTEPTWSDRFDRILTHRLFGLPFFFASMWIVLRVTADVTEPFLDWVDATVSGPIARWSVSLLELLSLDGGWVESMVVDGILAGVGGVLVFVPVLFGLYLMLAILEDSGYMARAAAVMDRAMRAVGIPGKAFLPMMVGFGCTVPAIYATRTLDSPRDRLLTGLITPFISCGARLPVYVLLAGVFFVGHRSTVVFSMYLLGILVAVFVGFIVSKTALRETEPAPFVMMMPEFRLPNVRTVWALVRQRTWAFIKGAGTVIFAASIAVWLLLSIPIGGGTFADAEPQNSAFGSVADAIAPVMGPVGFGEWEQSGSLITGFVAKEVVVGTMAQLYGAAESGDLDAAEPGGFVDDLTEIGTSFLEAARDTALAVPAVVGLDLVDLEDRSSGSLQSAIRKSFDESSGGHGALAAMAFMVFVLLYTPCMAAVAAFRHEFGTRWMWVSVIGQFIVAWIGAFLTYQGGRVLGLG